MVKTFPAIVSVVTLIAFFVFPAGGATLQLFTAERLSATVETAAVEIHEHVNGKVFVTATNATYPSETGEPDIPWQIVTVLLPPSADPQSLWVRLESAEYRSLDGVWEVRPQAPPATRDEYGNTVLVWPEDRLLDDSGRDALYLQDRFWPDAEVRTSHTGSLHQWQLAEIAVPLVRYNPVTQELQELVSGKVRIDFLRGRRLGISTEKPQVHRQAKNGRSRVSRMAANFADAAGEYEAAATETDGVIASADLSSDEKMTGAAGVNSTGYLILTTSNIVNNSTALAQFVAHKESRGWDVVVATEADWGGGIGSAAAVNIRNWLRANYISLDLLYVLLIGNPHPDSGDVPMRWHDDGRGNAPTDALYWDLSSGSGWDKYWEVLVGRVPHYGTISTLDAYLRKAIAYENSPAVLWRRNALLPMVPLDSQTPAYQCSEQIRSHLLAPNDITSTRIYRSLYGLSPEPEYLLSGRYPAIEWGSQPYGLVAWLTHGNQSSATEIVDIGSAWQLNDSYPSVVYQGACQNAWPENDANLAYRLLRHGAITTVASTRDSYYNIGQTDFTGQGSIGTLAYRYTRNLVVHRQSCGLALSNAKQQDYIYPPNATRMTLLGDPSIVLLAEPYFAAGDLNRDSRVDLKDFSIFSGQWLSAPGEPSADIAPTTPDGIVDDLDLMVLVEHWLMTE